jgi:hypothetical protein
MLLKGKTAENRWMPCVKGGDGNYPPYPIGVPPIMTG